MEYLHQVLDYCRHLDQYFQLYLQLWAAYLGPWLYVILFAIIFCETGLVVTPLLPGDSLLFMAGALAAGSSFNVVQLHEFALARGIDDSALGSLGGPALNIALLLPLLVVAAVAGDALNYLIGYHVGPKVFRSETSRLFNKKHLLRTEEFYERYGAKTIILARFIPIIRTFAPFVAGIGRMRYRQFAAFNVIGGVAWVCAFLLAGYLVGGNETVQKNFSIIIAAIIVISVLPGVVEFLRARRRAKLASGSGPTKPAVDLHEILPALAEDEDAAHAPMTTPDQGAAAGAATVPALAARLVSARAEASAVAWQAEQAAHAALPSVVAEPAPAAVTVTGPAPVQVVRAAPLSTVEVIAARVQGVFDTAVRGMYPGALIGAGCGLLFALWGVFHRGIFVNYVAVGVFGFVLWGLGGTFLGAGVGIAVGAVRGVVQALKPQPRPARK
jgi:membrane-associated protein